MIHLPRSKVIASFVAALMTGAAQSRAEDAAWSRQAWYGELHLHTSYSLDAYMGFGTRVDPDEAYRFARGDTVKGVRRTSRPLDFAAVTDHAEWMGVLNTLENPHSELSRSKLGQKARVSWISKRWPEEVGEWPAKPSTPEGVDISALEGATWQRTIDAANRNYVPGRFTTFIGYEWTVNFGANDASHLHRNVIFRGSTAPNPFSAIDSDKPEDLWRYLEAARKQGYEVLAIPHNSNLSDGVAFAWTDSNGRPIDRAYAEQRARNEPLVEITQQKGTSESHPLLSPNDEFANFELMMTTTDQHRKEGSYVRDALGRGLLLADRNEGVNPFKFGFVGASDFHTGWSESAENGFAGFAGWWGPVELTREGADIEQRVSGLMENDPAKIAEHIKMMDETSSAGLTAVWAESNTRESLHDALGRRETFATSGTRLKIRMFGSWAFCDDLLRRDNWVKVAYADGVPMGGDLAPSRDNRKAPTFALWAVKDPDGANLDRLQIIKVWLDQNGNSREHVFDVAMSDGRKPDGATGKVATVGNTVDVQRATYTNSIGNTELAAMWIDPDFDADAPALYYLRVLEIPTPRWTTVVAAHTGRVRPDSVPASIQERGWSSPIWYTPSRKQ